MATKLRPTRLSWRVIDDEVVVLDLQREEYFTLNAAGAAVWHLLVDGATMDELADVLMARFDVDADAAARDADAFVASLRERNLLA
jgi:hypothetical protein